MTSATTRSVSVRPSLLCGFIYLLTFGALASVLFSHFGFPLDDSWIHQVIARNFVQYHVLGFTPGMLTSGSTSLLWTMVLSAGRILFPGLSPVVFCAGLNGLLLAGIGFVLKRLTEADGVPAAASWCLALAPAMSGNFLWLGLTGMEHVLFILLCLCLVRQWSRPVAERGVVDGPLLFLIGILLVLTRPEGLCLVGLLIVASMVSRRGIFARPVWGRILALAGAVCGLGVTAWVNWRTTGGFLPQTMAGRRLLAPSRVEYLFQSWFQVMKTWNFYRLEGYLWRHGKMVGPPLFLLFLMLLGVALWRLWVLHAERFLFLCLWGATILGLYFVELPTPGHGGRYIAIPLMVCISLLLFGVSCVLRFTIRGDRGFHAALAGVMAVTVVASVYQWRIAMAADVDQIGMEHAAMAEWLAANMSAGDFASPRVGVFDIGRIGYAFHGNIIDLGALVDPKFLPYFLSHRTASYLRQREVQYVVIPGRAGEENTLFPKLLSLDQTHGVSLTEVHVSCAEEGIAKLALISSGTAFACQRLYRINYDSH